MKLSYDKSENAIKIADDIKHYYVVYKILIVLNLSNAILQLAKPHKEFGIQEIFWLVLGVLSLILFYVYFFKKSTAETLKIDNIKSFEKNSIFGKGKYRLKLKTGKYRELPNLKEEKQLVFLRGLLLDFKKPCF